MGGPSFQRVAPGWVSPSGSGPGALGQPEQHTPTWLCPTRADRVRLTDMSPAVRRARLTASLFCGLGVVLIVPWCGWAAVALFAAAAVIGQLLDRALERAKRPERVVAASLAGHTALIVVGVGLTGGVRSPILPWVAIPVVSAAARFRLLVFLTGSLIATVTVATAAALVSWHAFVSDPTPLIGVVVLFASLVVVQQPLLASEARWRRDAVLDPLTGLLNRQGLQRRFHELAEQARVAERPVCLVIFDLDEFKRVNDAHGHARGDAVLKDLAYTLRKEFRSFELIYRIGGEEMLLILPGADLSAGCEIAEQARRTIELSRPAGLPVTASFGVHSAAGEAIELEEMLDAADGSLYAAKRAGRNCVGYQPEAGGEAAVISRPIDDAPAATDGETLSTGAAPTGELIVSGGGGPSTPG